MKFPIVALLCLNHVGNAFVAPPPAYNNPTTTTSSSSQASSLHATPDLQDQWSNIMNKLPTTENDLSRQVSQEMNGLNSLLENKPDISKLSDSVNAFLENKADITKLLDQLKDSTVLKELENLGQSLQTSLQEFIKSHPQVEPYYQSAQAFLQQVDLPPLVQVLVSSITTYWVVSSMLSMGKEPPPSKPYPLLKYDSTSARQYYDQRLHVVLQRGLEVGLNSLQFGLNLAMDYVQNKLDENAEIRAVELAQLLTKLGPSFIKIGQSLSIRTDLLSPPYVRGLATLQDQVPPFDSKIAYKMLEEEWGVPVDSVLKEISPEPVAAASLGQVYKATTLDGKEVAIKVQRPNIMNQIALDMHLLREVAPVAKRLFNLNTDTVGTVDAWGDGFVDELDYISEAQNAKTFTESIQSTPLAKVVFAPPVVDEWTTRKVLMTEWVDGERLDQSSSEDVTVLCSIAMNTYLTMMLETGLLHCDPHPGNLLRTKADGRLCILDWGMVTRLDKNLQLTLIEHMAHLTSADYAEIPKDLLLLGFIPPEKKDSIRDSGVVETLADIYGAWTKGGGAATINVNKVIAQLQDLTATRGNLFQIPPYFAYIAKSFSVLEGIGLSNNPKYSIINECLPYVSKRLLTDKSSRAGGALNTFIFGPDKSNVDTRIIDYERVEQLVVGFGDYTTSASGALLAADGDASSKTALLENLSDQVLDLVLSEEETPIQSIVIEQFAKLLSSTSRSVWTTLRERSGTLPNGRTVLGTVVDPLGMWRTSPIVRMNELDSKTIETSRNLINLMQQQISSEHSNLDLSTLSREELLEFSTLLVQKLWDRRVGIVLTGNRLANQLLTLTANRLEKGEREVMTIPPPEKPQEKQAELLEPEASNSVTVQATPVAANAPKQSARLESARQLLSDIENDPSSWSMPPQ